MAKSITDPWSARAIAQFAPDDRSIPAAREVLKKGGFGTVEATADGRGWWVVCQGLTDQYEVSVRWDSQDNAFACECTCPSPKYPCKHALALLLYLSEHPELRVEKEETRRAAGDFEPLLRAVFANPDDDTPRLIFADFLDENGQPDRAALIRLQCEKARLDAKSKRFKELVREETPLLARIVAQHIEPLPMNFEVEFKRGFLCVRAYEEYQTDDINALPARFVELFRGGWVETVELSIYGYISPASLSLFRLAGELDVSRYQLREEGLLVLAAEAPVGTPDSRLARVKVHKQDEAIYRAFMSGGTERLPRTPRSHGPLSAARSYANVSAAQLGLLIRAGRLDGAAQLRLDGPIGDGGAELLANTDDLRQMDMLSLLRSKISSEGAARLATLGRFPSLRTLMLADAFTDSEACATLIRGSGLGQLTSLHLYGESVGSVGVLALAHATHFSRLESLQIHQTGATYDSIAEVLASEHFPRLRLVTLAGRNFSQGDGLRLTLSASDRRNLTLTLWGIEFERTIAANDGIQLEVRSDRHTLSDLREAVRGVTNGQRVTSLSMQRLGLTEQTLPYLAAALSPAKLKHFDLSGNKLGNDGMASFVVEFKDFRPETLVLSQCGIRKSGAVSLATSPLLSNVRILDLTHNNIGINGINAIADSPHITALQELRLQGTGLRPNEWKAIEQKLGKKVVV